MTEHSGGTGHIARPGKIIAIHLSYASRAAQRGRTPQHPSYFFKPSSSIASSGATVERPAGTELLAFEGEIALIIGTPARRVSESDAWAHVAGVTAANDLGLYDLRANDKGSNVRSKGRDGYTPLGPSVIDARGVDPAAIRVRTWVNGELRQDDSSAGMLFPLPRIVADLSQHMTLETGDVILTGTPAGSSVIAPGDVVEIEVDAAGQSSGRLVTTVVAGAAPFDPALGSLPAVDDVQRAEAWGDDAGAAGTAGVSTRSARSTNEDIRTRSDETVSTRSARSTNEEVRTRSDDSVSTRSARSTNEDIRTRSDETVSTRSARSTNEEVRSLSEDGAAARVETQPAGSTPPPTLSPELRARLLDAPTAGLSAQLRKRGHHACFIEGVAPNIPGAKIVGTAKTLRFIPFREDLFAARGGGYNAQKRAFDTVAEGEVLVIEARGDASAGTLGDILALRAQTRGAAGVVTDGAVRDFDAVVTSGFPVFSAGSHPSVLGRRHVPWDIDVTIACGGAAVQPGDVIVGDGDGVLVIPPALVAEIVDATLAQEREDAWIAKQVGAGHPVEGLFPMNAAWRARYEQETRA